MGKTFEEYQAEHLGSAFPFPLPGGGSVMIAKPTLDEERAAVAAATKAASLGGGLMAGLLTYVSQADGEKIAAAWGALPASALNDVCEDMKAYWGRKNSEASPPS